MKVRMLAGLFLLTTLPALSACGGMTNAVAVLPNTLDDLEAKSVAARGEKPLPPGCEQAPCEAGTEQ